jgi:hypothetical protein
MFNASFLRNFENSFKIDLLNRICHTAKSLIYADDMY